MKRQLPPLCAAATVADASTGPQNPQSRWQATRPAPAIHAKEFNAMDPRYWDRADEEMQHQEEFEEWERRHARAAHRAESSMTRYDVGLGGSTE